MRITPAVAAVLLAVALEVPALAAPSVASSYRYTGSLDGTFTGTLELAPAADGSFAATAHEVRGSTVVEWSGSANLDPSRVLTIVRASEGSSVGLAGALAGAHATPAPHREYVAVFDEKLERAQVRVYQVDAQGNRTELGSAALETHEQLWEKVPGDLLALGEKTLDKAVHKELDLQKDFSVSQYLNVGVKTSAQLMADGERTAEMKESDRVFRAAGKGEPAWVRTTVEGGPTVSWSQGVPVDPSGAFSLSFGFSAGAHVRYVCEDQYRLPDGITDAQGILDAIESVPAETFDLPLTADAARKLSRGSHRLLDGAGSLAISGGANVGLRLEQLGILNGDANLDLAASLGVHWSIAGDLRLEVTREGESNVRVHWTRGTAKDIGANASLLLGLTLDDAARNRASELLGTDAHVPSSVAGQVVTAIVNKGQSYTRVQFSFGADWQNADQLDVDLVFDLSNEKARPFFEAAVRGNVTLAQDLGTKGPDAGVVACKVTSTLTDALASNSDVNVFDLLSYHDAERTAEVRVDVRTQDGTHSVTDMRSYDDTTHHLFGGDDQLSALATDREVDRPNAPTLHGRQVVFTAKHVDKRTSGQDVTDDLAIARLLLGDAVASDAARLAPKQLSDGYGKTELDLSIALGQSAMDKVLATDKNTFLAAYARTFVEQRYAWTPERIKALRWVSPGASNNDESWAEQQEHQEAADLREAQDIYDYIKHAQGKDAAARLQAFSEMAKDNGYKLRAVVTLAVLAGGQDTRVSVKLTGKGLDLDRTAGSVEALPDQP